MPESQDSVTLLGRAHAITLPDFGTREAIIFELGKRLKSKNPMTLAWYYAGVIGCCVPRIDRESGASLAGEDYDLVAYGRKVYSYMRESDPDLTAAQIGEIAASLIRRCQENLFPRQHEVDAVAKN